MVASIWDFWRRARRCSCMWLHTGGLYGHRKRVCTESWLWEKNALPHQGIEPASVLRLVLESDALPTELSDFFFRWCFKSTETIRLIRDGRMEVGEEGDYILDLSLHYHRQNDSCIKIGSDESHFNVSSIIYCEGQSHKYSVHKPQNVWRERWAEAESSQEPSATSLTPYP